MTQHMPRIVVDATDFPLVVHAMLPDYTDDDVETMLRSYDALLAGNQRYAIVVYFHPDAPIMRASMRKRVAEWWTLRRERVNHLNVISATVVRSALIRGALTALQWLVQPENPHVAAATIGDAIDLCLERLCALDIPRPARTRSELLAKYAGLP